ncbi:MAG: substrate-binding domain-containing protein [Candidatus Eremiobacteraeota bacterium]|nr:substrate-binding domain-containing protein [Candidatus Eremiobacteraeota bacterium]
MQSGAATVAFVDSPPAPGSPLVSQQIFAIPLAIAISPQAGVANLTRAQAAGVFNGGYKSWKELGGADLPVRVFTRPAQSAMSAAFQNVFGILPRSGEVMVGSAEVTDAIRATPGGVGFTTYAAAHQANLPIATVDGFAPAGPLGHSAYPFYAVGYVVTNGPPNLALSRFLAFIETRRPILAKYGIVSFRDLR